MTHDLLYLFRVINSQKTPIYLLDWCSRHSISFIFLHFLHIISILPINCPLNNKLWQLLHLYSFICYLTYHYSIILTFLQHLYGDIRETNPLVFNWLGNPLILHNCLYLFVNWVIFNWLVFTNSLSPLLLASICISFCSLIFLSNALCNWVPFIVRIMPSFKNKTFHIFFFVFF